jgi:uncharacterized protein (TIGR02266 family)
MADRGEDQRLHPRIPWVVRVDYPDRAKCLDATENLSAGGLFVQTDQAFSIGEEVPLALSFPGLLDPIRITGVVAWIRPTRGEERGGVGVRVEGAEDRRKLGRLVEAATAAAPRHIAAVPSTPPVGGYRILIVEDNPHVAEMYTYVLRKLSTGLEGKVQLDVDFAKDGHDALTRLRNGTFHLVLSDLYMPVLDGFELVQRIRGDAVLKHIPMVVISGAGRDAEQKALQYGVDMYLRKPVRFVEVLETVKRLLHLN